MPSNIASLGKRIAAGLIDCFFALLVITILGIVLGDAYAGGGAQGNFAVGVNGPSCIIGAVVIIFLFTFMEFKFGKTPGKFLFQTKVVSETGAPITVKQSIIRNLLRLIDGIVFYLIGVILIAFGKNNQRLGDLSARTIVIDESKAVRI